MGKLNYVLAAALLLTGCAAAPTTSATDPIVARLDSAAELILIGEIHGTREIPAEFGRIVRTASRSWGRVNVGVELPQAAIDGANCGASEPRSDSYWRRPNQDGRTSSAMRSLVCSLKSLGDKGKINLFAIVPDQLAGYARHPYYELIATQVRQSSTPTLILLGNFHARRAPGALAQLLSENGVALTTLTVSSPTAVAWNCRGQGECGAGEIGARFCDVHPETVQLVLDEPSNVRPPQWDGCLAFPELSPSPPA